MDEEYIFTRSEFAKMLDLTPNCVRMRMRRGHFAEESKYIKNKWMFRRPRLKQVLIPSPLSPVSRHRKHVITRQGSSNYDNIRNPVTARKFREQNDMLRLDKKWGHLTDKKLEALLLLADKEQEKVQLEKQKKAFEDPFMLAEKMAHKKRRDQWLMDLDEAECGDYDRKKASKEEKGYY